MIKKSLKTTSGLAFWFIFGMIAGSLSLYFCSSGLAQSPGSIVTTPPPDTYTTTTIIPGSSRIRAVDINDLRFFLNTKRVAAGLGAYAFTDPVLTPGVSRVRAIHFAELQVALKEIYDKPSGVPPVIWQQWFRTNYRAPLDPIAPTGGIISPSSLRNIINYPIKATTMSSLRNAIAAAGVCGDLICQNYSGTGPENCSNCPGDCLLACTTVTNPLCGAPCGSGNCNSSSKCQTQTCPAAAGPATCTVTSTCVANIACTCGNTVCDVITGETAANCATDCAGCGNGTINAPEVCDGGSLGGQTCVTQGFPLGGTLTCNASCTGFITTACTICNNNGICNGPGENGTNCPGDCCDSSTGCFGTHSTNPAEYCRSFNGGAYGWKVNADFVALCGSVANIGNYQQCNRTAYPAGGTWTCAAPVPTWNQTP